MIVKRADGYWVALRRHGYSGPVGPVMQWGPFPTRAAAVATEQRHRAALAKPSAAPKTRARRPAVPPLLAAIEESASC